MLYHLIRLKNIDNNITDFHKEYYRDYYNNKNILMAKDFILKENEYLIDLYERERNMYTSDSFSNNNFYYSSLGDEGFDFNWEHTDIY